MNKKWGGESSFLGDFLTCARGRVPAFPLAAVAGGGNGGGGDPAVATKRNTTLVDMQAVLGPGIMAAQAERESAARFAAAANASEQVSELPGRGDQDHGREGFGSLFVLRNK